MAEEAQSGGTESADVDATLRARAAELSELRRFEDSTTFSGDQREAYDELSVVDQHPADVADQTYQRELDETIREVLDREAQQVKEAQARRAAGVYGICTRCGRPIDPERLRARPEATLCITCQREVEAAR